MTRQQGQAPLGIGKSDAMTTADPPGEAAAGSLQQPLEKEAREVAARLEQGAAPDLYRRLESYYDALRVAQAVLAVYQRQRADATTDDDGEGGRR